MEPTEKNARPMTNVVLGNHQCIRCEKDTAAVIHIMTFGTWKLWCPTCARHAFAKRWKLDFDLFKCWYCGKEEMQVYVVFVDGHKNNWCEACARLYKLL